jgi:molybdopterin converting factor small subunit
MKVLYFSSAALAAGCREEEWIVAGALTQEAFWQEALQRHPALEQVRAHCRLAGGGRYLQPGQLLEPHVEVAVIPPVSGG